CGLFTSPHLVSVRERVRLGTEEAISEADFVQILAEVQQKSSQNPPLKITFFEALTAVALLWFQRQGVQIAVLEAGLGGRLDSTAIAQGSWTVLSSIGLDHQDVLGSSLQDVLREKLGIWQRGSLWHTLLCNLIPLDFEYQQIIAEQAQSIDGKVREVSSDEFLTLPHAGPVYQSNAHLALAVSADILAKQFDLATKPSFVAKSDFVAKFDAQKARQVLARSPWWGRAQILRKQLPENFRKPFQDSQELHNQPENSQSQSENLQKPLQKGQNPLEYSQNPLQKSQNKSEIDWILDGAHNRAASEALARTLAQIYPSKQPLVLMMGVLKTKNPAEIMEPLLPWIAEIHWVRTPHAKMRNPQELQKFSQEKGIKSFAHASLDEAVQLLEAQSDVLCVGSLYLIGALVAKFSSKYPNLVWFRQFKVSDENEY
ncbi:MAG: hypothetical protein GX801_00410, partial [Fibrobacter sp.]|nr:hypothetical protein [Fibrobacter sp.]